MKTLQDVAQAMLDRYGFFVICCNFPRRIGAVEETAIAPGSSPFRDKMTAIKFKVVSLATEDDYAKQCDLGGVEHNSTVTNYRYRAVAE